MVTICIGPVCVPLHLLLPFLVGVLHRYGWLKWFKPEWVTLRFWQKWWSGSSQKVAEVKAKPDVAKADEAVQVAMQQDKAATGSTNSRNTSNQQQSSSSQNNIPTSQQSRSVSGRPAGLQQRKPGESELKQSPALPR
ncbi:TPA: hypothetical protein ACH3X3_000887 [Trebouxia sp. C0006]